MVPEKGAPDLAEAAEQARSLTDEAAALVPSLFPAWRPDADYAVGARVRDGGQLLRCQQAHRSRAGQEPHLAPALWARVLPGQGGSAPGEWERPGSTNPYARGDRVTFGGRAWESTIDGNVWSPGEHPDGWREVG